VAGLGAPVVSFPGLQTVNEWVIGSEAGAAVCCMRVMTGSCEGVCRVAQVRALVTMTRLHTLPRLFSAAGLCFEGCNNAKPVQHSTVVPVRVQTRPTLDAASGRVEQTTPWRGPQT
jgi:hypothetical protein